MSSSFFLSQESKRVEVLRIQPSWTWRWKNTEVERQLLYRSPERTIKDTDLKQSLFVEASVFIFHYFFKEISFLFDLRESFQLSGCARLTYKVLQTTRQILRQRWSFNFRRALVQTLVRGYHSVPWVLVYNRLVCLLWLTYLNLR